MDRLLEAVELADTRGDPSRAEVTSVEIDSRSVRPGALFCCVPGRHVDGHDFAASAVEAGAVGLLVEHPLPVDVPQGVAAPGTVRRATARLACRVEGDPSRAVPTVGVTGTNGKTTVTHLLAAVLEAHGWPCAVIGTLGGPRTTPEAPELQRLLAAARDGGKRAVAMEVSSHALREERVEGTWFAAAVFTNLTQDHLDYHGTMDAYFEAKASLFSPDRAAVGVVDADDPYGARLLERAPIPMVPFGAADATDVAGDAGGTTFTWRGRRVRVALPGRYHVLNALAAATTAAVLGVPDGDIAAGLEGVTVVPGRFEVVALGAPFTAGVDYAHTPDGLRAALASARTLAGRSGGRVLVVFGAGGERDTGKRPTMGAVAAAGADEVVLTSDNPRSEDPLAIIEQVRSGVATGAAVTVEPDRRLAIALAVARARPGDVVLVAGKGHEQWIDIGGRRVPFEDRTELARAWGQTAGGEGARR
ncbi:MAG: UDP-N-acetylmuramoyl-L-alanyl-D-glutamate--2,6-diaminopimelate ligase [Acidobacteriota bacterium]|nr:UDP-N-acetylmuramoyl-L-alanyl-D-glutamate--2,6-diaminopimelate ligase [Acidobacteriota bacterium]